MKQKVILTFLAGLGLAPIITPGATPADAAAARPNVLILFVDDYAAEWTELYPHSPARTPNLRRLAARSVWFRQAHCAAPACAPSRTSLLTGVEPHRSGVYLNNQPYRRAGTWISGVTNLPQQFLAQGYLTAGYGKIFHHMVGMQEDDAASWSSGHFFPLKEEEDFALGRQARPQTVVAGIPNSYSWGPLPDAFDRDDPALMQQDTRNANHAIKLLGQPTTDPFFCATGLYRPHLRWYVPKRYYDLHPLESIQAPAGFRWDDLDDIPAGGQRMRRAGIFEGITGQGHWKAAIQAYLAAISYVDAQIGRVLDALEAGPHANNTIVILVGDNGWQNGEKNHFSKYTLWETATKVPLMISVPGAKPGVCDSPVSLVDLYPTLLRLCGLPAPSTHELDGVDLSGLLGDPARERGRPVLITQGAGNHAVRSRDYRYIRYRDGTEELYRSAVDPHEWHNLAGDAAHLRIKEELKALLPEKCAEPVPAVGTAVGG
jgi:arylsulfatase A-like enzyme